MRNDKIGDIYYKRPSYLGVQNKDDIGFLFAGYNLDE